MLNTMGLLLALIAGFLFLELVALKMIVRIATKIGMAVPFPPRLNWLLDNPLRRYYTPLILKRTGLSSGETALELGTGPGVFTACAARLLGPTGRLVSVDIQPEMIASVQRNIQAARLTNVKTFIAGAYGIPVSDGTVDRAFLIGVLAEIPDQSRALSELLRVIKPTGTLSITEEFPDPDYPFACETIRRVEANGFKLYARHGNFWLYTLNFKKDL